jgi:hypothetical protein
MAKTAKTLEAATANTAVAEQPREQEIGEAWNGIPVESTEEYGYKGDPAAEPKLPKYDYSGVDDHPGPEDAAEEKPDPEPEKPKEISRSDWADYGLTEEEARSLDEKGELGRALDLIDRRFAKLGSESTPKDAAPKAQDAPSYRTLETKLDPDIYDEGLIGQVNEIVDYVKSLHQKLEEVTGSSRRQRMDAFFAGLGEDYESVFGKGSLDDLPSRSVLRERRLEVERTVEALRAGYERTGQPIPSENVLMERSARMVAGNEMQALARKRAAEQARDAQGQFVAKPTHREGRPHTGRERAVQFVENFYRRKGM